MKYIDGKDELDYLTLSVHTGKTYQLDGTLIRSTSIIPPYPIPRIRLNSPSELNGKTLCVIANGEFYYINPTRVEVEMLIGYPKADIDGKYPLLAMYYEDGGRRLALSGADIESITVFSESFEAQKTIERG